MHTERQDLTQKIQGKKSEDSRNRLIAEPDIEFTNHELWSKHDEYFKKLTKKIQNFVRVQH